jgi:hypothetical protein
VVELQGAGTQESPFLVHNADELNAVRNNMSAHYLQMCDIDMSSYDSSVEADYGYGFSPIGRYLPYNEFTGVYDGGGYKITNLLVDCYHPELYPPESCVVRGDGLFGMLGTNGILRNIHIVDAHIEGQHNSALLLGYAMGDDLLVENCTASGYVYGHMCQSGGLLGVFIGGGGTSQVINCHVLLVDANTSLTSAKGYSPLTSSGEPPFVLDNGEPFGQGSIMHGRVAIETSSPSAAKYVYKETKCLLELT